MISLVTGGAGFIGSAIAHRLVEADHNVRVFDNLSTGFVSNVPQGAELIQADIRDLAALEAALRGVEVVFHEAAFKSVPKSLDDPLMAESCNGVGTLNVLLAARKQGVGRVIYASSSSVYGDSVGIKHEDLPANPISPYGVSKLTGEHYCRCWGRFADLATVCLRYFNVFGPGQRADSQYSAVFPAFISSLQKGNRASIYGDGQQTCDFTFIDDVVSANLAAMNSQQVGNGEVINVCAGAPKTVNEVYQIIAHCLGSRSTPKHLAPRKGDIRHSYGDIARAKLLLGWAPVEDWTRSVGLTVDWLIAQAEDGRTRTEEKA